MLKKIHPLITSLLFFLITSSWALMIKSNLLSENPSNTIAFLYLYIYFFILVQSIAIYIILGNEKLIIFFKFIFIGLLFTINFYVLVLSISSEFTILQFSNKIKDIAISSIIIFLVTFIFISNYKILKILCFFYLFSNLFYFFNVYEKVISLTDGNNKINTFSKTNFSKKK